MTTSINRTSLPSYHSDGSLWPSSSAEQPTSVPQPTQRVEQQNLPSNGPHSTWWDPYERGVGQVVAVIGAQPGCGASGIALALADAAAHAGFRTLLIDQADPARSGLAGVANRRLRSDAPSPDGVAVGSAARGAVTIRSVVGTSRPVNPWQLPALHGWVTPALLQGGRFDVTIVDVGWDVWPLLSHLEVGPLAWMTAAGVAPVLVTHPGRSGLRQAATITEAWQSWVRAAKVDRTNGLQLAVSHAAAWAPTVEATMPDVLRDTASTAAFFPPHASATVDGWTVAPTPVSWLRPASALLSGAGPRLRSQFPNEVPAKTRTAIRLRRRPPATQPERTQL